MTGIHLGEKTTSLVRRCQSNDGTLSWTANCVPLHNLLFVFPNCSGTTCNFQQMPKPGETSSRIRLTQILMHTEVPIWFCSRDVPSYNLTTYIIPLSIYSVCTAPRQIRVFRVCFRAPFLPPFVPHASPPSFPFRPCPLSYPFLPSSPPPHPLFSDWRKTQI